MQEKLRIAMLISGSGTTMEAIIKACKSGRLKRVEPALVIASYVEGEGIRKAKAAGIPIVALSSINYMDKERLGRIILIKCKERRIDFIGQYGWLPKTPEMVIREYSGMIINQHPGPLRPGKLDFGGKGMFGRRVHCARLYFVRKVGHDFWTEATAQRVAVEYDKGAILKIGRMDIHPYDDPISLQGRLLPIEHETQIQLLEDFSNNAVFEMRRVEPLLRLGERKILEEAKAVAKILFPKG